eukprot:COSAG02_NODE_794_length_17142_cov_13.622367_17_plen_862_part_00
MFREAQKPGLDWQIQPTPPGVARHRLLTEGAGGLAGKKLELAVLHDPATAWTDDQQPACGYWQLNTRRHGGMAFDAWNVRAQPSRSAAIVGSVPHGTVVGVRQQTSDASWLRLAAGWVQRKHDGAGWTKCSSQSHEPARVVAQRFAALCLADGGHPTHWASDTLAGDAPLAPSGFLLFRMRRYIASRRLQLQPMLEQQTLAGGMAGPGPVIRATFGQSGGMRVVANGTEVICSNGGPCTVVSNEVATRGLMAWIVKNTGDNSCMLLGAVQDGFETNLARAPDRPEWGVNSAHGHDPRFRVVKCEKNCKFIVVANLDVGTLSIYKIQEPRWGAPSDMQPEKVLEAPVSGPIRFCICLYNGGRFTLVPDPLPESLGVSETAAAAVQGATKRGRGGRGASSNSLASDDESAAVAPLPVSARLSLGAMYALLRQAVRSDKAMCNAAIGAVQEMVTQLSPQSLSTDDDLQDWVLLLQEMAEQAIGDTDTQLLEKVLAVLVSLALAQGQVAQLLQCVHFLVKIDETSAVAGMTPRVPLSKTVIKAEIAVRAALGISQKSGLDWQIQPEDGALCSSISVDLTHGSLTNGCFAQAGLCSNGTHLFVRTSGDAPEVLKLGTGLNGTLLGHVYDSVLCSKFGAECAACPWIGTLGSNFLLLQGAKSHTVLVLSTAELEFQSTIYITPSKGCTESTFYTTSGMELHCVELWNDSMLDDGAVDAEDTLDKQPTVPMDDEEASDLGSESNLKLIDRVVQSISAFDSTGLVEMSPDTTVAVQREYSAVSSALRSFPVCASKEDAASKTNLLGAFPKALPSPRKIVQLLQADAFTVLLTQEGTVWVRSRSSFVQLRDAQPSVTTDNGPRTSSIQNH